MNCIRKHKNLWTDLSESFDGHCKKLSISVYEVHKEVDVPLAVLDTFKECS